MASTETHAPHAIADEPQELAARIFKLTIAYVIAFAIMVPIVLRYLPSNEGEDVPPQPPVLTALR